MIFTVSVESANLKNSGGIIKPHPYVELHVDDFKKHRSGVAKNTYQPKWNNEFTMYVYYVYNSYIWYLCNIHLIHIEIIHIFILFLDLLLHTQHCSIVC